MDYYLKADSEAELWQALKTAGAAVSYDVKNEAGDVIETVNQAAPGYVIDIIGTIYKPTGNMVRTMVEDYPVDTPETVALPGFHANLRGPADLAPKVVYTPYQPTPEEQQDPNFVAPASTETVTPSPIQALLVFPQNPVRVWF